MANSEFLTLAGRLKWARLRKDLSQSALAVRCGLTQGTIGHVEAGSRHSLANIARVAHELGVRALWLEEGVGPALEEDTQTTKEPEQTAGKPPGYLSSEEISQLIALYGRSNATGRDSIMRAAQIAADMADRDRVEASAANEKKRSSRA